MSKPNNIVLPRSGSTPKEVEATGRGRSAVYRAASSSNCRHWAFRGQGELLSVTDERKGAGHSKRFAVGDVQADTILDCRVRDIDLPCPGPVLGRAS